MNCLYRAVVPRIHRDWFADSKTCLLAGVRRALSYPERFAQEALGHNSKAIHRAYACKAQVRLPSLESYEKQNVEGRIIPLVPPLPKPERNGHSVSAVG
jgi:hypothetical protein